MSLVYKTYEPEDNIFDNLVIDITHRCNMNCANCYIPNRDIPDLDLTGFYDLLKRLPFKTFIRLIGAEPTMRKDLCEIITNVKKHRHHPLLATNGLKLSVPKYVKCMLCFLHNKLKITGANRLSLTFSLIFPFCSK